MIRQLQVKGKMLLFRLLIVGLFGLWLMQGCSSDLPQPEVEGRGIWLHRFEYCQVTSTHDQDSIRAYIRNVIESAAEANFNMIFFQVRGNGDAYYPSDIEPWGQLLTGELGRDPGWDPLQFAIDLTHEHGMELHAYLNTFPAWRGKEPPPMTDPPSPYLAHPEWLVKDRDGNPQALSNHYVTFSPAIPAVHDYLISLVDDIASRYDIDGIHWDYIRYPEQSPQKGYSHDPVSMELFNSADGNPEELEWEDWQRQQLNAFVSKVYNHLRREYPRIKMSAAAIGSHIKGGWNGYHAVYQDARRWAELGKIDFVAPMLYWPLSSKHHPFLIRSRNWRNEYSFERYVFPGIGSYRYNEKKRGYNPQEILDEIGALRYEGIRGMLYFDAKSIENHYAKIAEKYYKYPAKLPPMPWKNIDSLKTAPALELLTNEGKWIELAWQSPEMDNIHRICLYSGDGEDMKSRRLALISADMNGRIRIARDQISGDHIALSAVNDAWIESPLSQILSTDVNNY